MFVAREYDFELLRTPQSWSEYESCLHFPGPLLVRSESRVARQESIVGFVALD